MSNVYVQSPGVVYSTAATPALSPVAAPITSYTTASPVLATSGVWPATSTGTPIIVNSAPITTAIASPFFTGQVSSSALPPSLGQAGSYESGPVVVYAQPQPVVRAAPLPVQNGSTGALIPVDQPSASQVPSTQRSKALVVKQQLYPEKSPMLPEKHLSKHGELIGVAHGKEPHPNPMREYVCDGHTINDEQGNAVLVLKSRPGDFGTDLLNPTTRQPVLRYNKNKRNITDMQVNKVVACVSHEEKSILHGDPALYKDAKVPPRMYRYEVDETDGVNMHIWVYDAPTGQHLASIRRRSDGFYPSRITIQPHVPYHALLIMLFLV
eukprot:TRINITY_DN747_c0_g1_i1.p1 TRINITY_DN747_c0_g1~~TRINITY_DN747_c0_g1_i1.p1  ORF type:complete len:331 (+),score=58.69 TRINITY_DN747_c0_g1_i1:24-995(+)